MKVQLRARSDIAGVLASVPGIEAAIVFDVRVGPGGDLSCGLLVAGEIPMRQLLVVLESKGLRYLASSNWFVVTLADLRRRLDENDPYIREILADPTRWFYWRCSHPGAASGSCMQVLGAGSRSWCYS